jgi:hypothetical protein
MSHEEVWDRVMRPHHYQSESGDFVELCLQNFDKGLYCFVAVAIVVIVLMMTSNEWQDFNYRRRNRAAYRAARRKSKKDKETYSFPVWNEWHHTQQQKEHHDV